MGRRKRLELSFSLSPASPQHKETPAEERARSSLEAMQSCSCLHGNLGDTLISESTLSISWTLGTEPMISHPAVKHSSYQLSQTCFNCVLTYCSFSLVELSCTRGACSRASWVRKFGYLCIQEILVIMCLSTCLSASQAYQFK